MQEDERCGPRPDLDLMALQESRQDMLSHPQKYSILSVTRNRQPSLFNLRCTRPSKADSNLQYVKAGHLYGRRRRRRMRRRRKQKVWAASEPSSTQALYCSKYRRVSAPRIENSTATSTNGCARADLQPSPNLCLCGINKQGSSLMLKRCHTNTTTKTWVTFSNSHLDCE